jgi:hypothetical protein
MKEALGMERFSLKRLSAEGSFPGDTEKYVKEIYQERCKNAL